MRGAGGFGSQDRDFGVGYGVPIGVEVLGAVVENWNLTR